MAKKPAARYFSAAPKSSGTRSQIKWRATRAVAEVIDTRTRSGGSLRVKLFDKRAALEAPARHLGMTTGVGADAGQKLPPLRVIIQEATDKKAS